MGSTAKCLPISTTGEILPGGRILEVLCDSTGGLGLLLKNPHGKTIGPQVAYAGRMYEPRELDETIRRAIRFPHDVKGYGSTAKLFRRMQELFQRHAGLSRPHAALMTAWTASSWFPDCLSSPPVLVISGPEMDHAVALFRVLHCLCRRPVMLGELNRNAFLQFASLGATLLINQPSFPTKMRDLWSTSNYRGVCVVGKGQVYSVAGSKAIFLGMTDERGNDGMHFALPPSNGVFSLFNEEQQGVIAEELQPQLLMYRLENFQKVRDFSASKDSSPFAATPIARDLAASVLGDAEIIRSIAPLLRSSEQDTNAQRGCSVHQAIIEVTWALAHKQREISVSRLTDLTNACLRCRGETWEYSAPEIGWKLRNFGFPRHRSGHGMDLRFTHENRLLLHQLAARKSMDFRAFPNCDLCTSREPIVTQ